MFHVKRFSKEDYIALLKLWDKKHHLIGRSSPTELYQQSVTALKSLERSVLNVGAIDLGAGNGILGIPALLEGFVEKVCLVEPLIKRVAFLEAIKADMRAKGDTRYAGLIILPMAVQDVSRETFVEHFGEGFDKVCVISRAFSGTLTMKEALGRSALRANSCYKFFVSNEANSSKYMLLKEDSEGKLGDN